MESRNVQRTNDMHYLYLPTKWCKRNKIEAKTKVGITTNPDGSLLIYPQVQKKKIKNLKFKIEGNNKEVLHKLIVACYTSPADSFTITIDKGLDITSILNQKNLLSLELIEIDGSSVSCESSLQVNNPSLLLRTIIRKVRNLLIVMNKDAPRELLDMYEAEIDRNRILIEKAIISSLTNSRQVDQTAAELHFISVIAKELERLADHSIKLKKKHKLLEKVNSALALVKDILEDPKRLNYNKILRFLEDTDKLHQVNVKDIETYNLHRIVRCLNSISEVLVDWVVLQYTSRS